MPFLPLLWFFGHRFPLALKYKTEIFDQPTTWKQINTLRYHRYGEDDILQFKSTIRLGKKDAV